LARCITSSNNGAQKISFIANWITRGSPADVIVPNAAAPTVVFGAPSARI
jgi:hypothetical protein